MLRFIIRRILMMIPVLLGVLIIVFTLNEFMPGDPVRNRLPQTYTQEQYDSVKHEMGLDRPFVVRLGSYIYGIATRFDLGTSYDTNQPVASQIRTKMWPTIQIGLLSTCLVGILGITAGIISAIRQNSALDYTVTAASIFLASLPGFWLALMSIILFSLTLKWLPASGLTTWKHYILPVICASLMTIAVITRMTRSSMLEVIRQDYIRTARAKGMKEGKIIRKHALKNALIPVITIIGGQLSMMIGGSVIIENIFSIPGMGKLMVTSINYRDYPMITGITLIISLFVCAVNLLIDLAYSFVDPRIKEQFAEGASRRRRVRKTEG